MTMLLAHPHADRVTRESRAFSLIEVLLAIFILGVGVISIAALFPRVSPSSAPALTTSSARRWPTTP